MRSGTSCWIKVFKATTRRNSKTCRLAPRINAPVAGATNETRSANCRIGMCVNHSSGYVRMHSIEAGTITSNSQTSGQDENRPPISGGWSKAPEAATPGPIHRRHSCEWPVRRIRYIGHKKILIRELAIVVTQQYSLPGIGSYFRNAYCQISRCIVLSDVYLKKTGGKQLKSTRIPSNMLWFYRHRTPSLVST